MLQDSHVETGFMHAAHHGPLRIASVERWKNILGLPFTLHLRSDRGMESVGDQRSDDRDVTVLVGCSKADMPARFHDTPTLGEEGVRILDMFKDAVAYGQVNALVLDRPLVKILDHVEGVQVWVRVPFLLDIDSGDLAGPPLEVPQGVSPG